MTALCIAENGSWSECVPFCTKTLLSLKVALENPPAQRAEARVRKLTRKLMPWAPSLHPHGSAKPCSTALLVRHSLLLGQVSFLEPSAQGGRRARKDKRFTFIGPGLFGARRFCRSAGSAAHAAFRTSAKSVTGLQSCLVASTDSIQPRTCRRS